MTGRPGSEGEPSARDDPLALKTNHSGASQDFTIPPPTAAYAEPLQFGVNAQDVIVLNGKYPYELRVEITNPEDIAYEIYYRLDGMSVSIANPDDIATANLLALDGMSVTTY